MYVCLNLFHHLSFSKKKKKSTSFVTCPLCVCLSGWYTILPTITKKNETTGNIKNDRYDDDIQNNIDAHFQCGLIIRYVFIFYDIFVCVCVIILVESFCLFSFLLSHLMMMMKVILEIDTDGIQTIFFRLNEGKKIKQ